MKRLAAPKAIPITDRKEKTWLLKASPGPHCKESAVPLLVLMRDMLKVAETAREIKKAITGRLVSVDGKIRTDVAFPVGLMDYVSFADKRYRIMVDSKARLMPVEISDGETKKKIMKVIGKNTIKKGKIMIMLHNGRTMLADNNVNVGDSLIISVPGFKIEKVLKLEKGTNCLIVEGKHAGMVAKLEEIIERKGSMDAEAKLSSPEGEFITVAKYLFVVDDSIKGAA
jgi:small subunit ribosomal protein S4e